MMSDFDRAEREAQEPPDEEYGPKMDCPECDGKGTVPDEDSFDEETGVCSMVECPECGGEGQVIIPLEDRGDP